MLKILGSLVFCLFIFSFSIQAGELTHAGRILRNKVDCLQKGSASCFSEEASDIDIDLSKDVMNSGINYRLDPAKIEGARSINVSLEINDLPSILIGNSCQDLWNDSRLNVYKTGAIERVICEGLPARGLAETDLYVNGCSQSVEGAYDLKKCATLRLRPTSFNSGNSSAEYLPIKDEVTHKKLSGLFPVTKYIPIMSMDIPIIIPIVMQEEKPWEYQGTTSANGAQLSNALIKSNSRITFGCASKSFRSPVITWNDNSRASIMVGDREYNQVLAQCGNDLTIRSVGLSSNSSMLTPGTLHIQFRGKKIWTDIWGSYAKELEEIIKKDTSAYRSVLMAYDSATVGSSKMKTIRTELVKKLQTSISEYLLLMNFSESQYTTPVESRLIQILLNKDAITLQDSENAWWNAWISSPDDDLDFIRTSVQQLSRLIDDPNQKNQVVKLLENLKIESRASLDKSISYGQEFLGWTQAKINSSYSKDKKILVEIEDAMKVVINNGK